MSFVYKGHTSRRRLKVRVFFSLQFILKSMYFKNTCLIFHFIPYFLMPIKNDDREGTQRDQVLIQATLYTATALCSMMTLHVISGLKLPQAMPAAGMILMKTADRGPAESLRVWGWCWLAWSVDSTTP